MPNQMWSLIAAQGDGTAVTGTAEGSLLPGQAKLTIPANFLDVVGKSLRLTATGRISNIATTPGTLTLKTKLGPTANIIAATSQAMQLNTTVQTNVTWKLIWDLTMRSVGAGTAAALMHVGEFKSISTAPAASAIPENILIPASAPAVGTGFDSTVANLLDLTATFSLTGNSMQLHQFYLESLN